jgi:hypothetical protein
MKRVLLIILLHLSLFFIVFAYQAQAEEEEWTIDSLETMAYARVSGEVIHGDNLNFFIDPGDIKQLIGKHIPITINGEEITAKVEFISPFLKLGWRVLFTIGTYPVQEYINVLNNFYIEEKKYEIKIIDGIDFKAEKYFDISVNSWKLDKLVPSVLEAHKLCKQLNNMES